jgi:hypothetical protein
MKEITQKDAQKMKKLKIDVSDTNVGLQIEKNFERSMTPIN